MMFAAFKWDLCRTQPLNWDAAIESFIEEIGLKLLIQPIMKQLFMKQLLKCSKSQEYRDLYLNQKFVILNLSRIVKFFWSRI